jgi:hypothetical protein
MRIILREMCSRAGGHTAESGHGVLNPMSLLQHGRDHMFNTLKAVCPVDETQDESAVSQPSPSRLPSLTAPTP